MEFTKIPPTPSAYTPCLTHNCGLIGRSQGYLNTIPGKRRYESLIRIKTEVQSLFAITPRNL